MSRTKQQKIGDKLEQAALAAAREFFPGARLTKGSGSVNQDGDISGIYELYVECKNTDRPGKGRSISKSDWTYIKACARRWLMIPVHLGFDDDGEIVALIPFKDLIALYRERLEGLDK